MFMNSGIYGDGVLVNPSPSQNEQVSNEATGMPLSFHSVHTFPRPEHTGHS